MTPNWPVSLVNKAVPGGHRDRCEKPVGTPVDVLQVNVSLRGMRPPIWRLEVPARITLAGLQAVLRAAFGWTDGHLHRFEVSARGRRPRLNPARVARRHRHRPAGLPLRLRRRLDPPIRVGSGPPCCRRSSPRSSRACAGSAPTSSTCTRFTAWTTRSRSRRRYRPCTTS
jgi:hypothetical protein